MILLLALVQNLNIDIDQFEKLYNQYKNLMFRVSFDILKDKGVAEDAVQQSFIKIIEIFNTLDLEDCNKTKRLFVLICKNTSIDYYRKNKNNQNFDIDQFYNIKDDKAEIDYENIENEVERAIRLLPEIYCVVFFLKYIQGCSNFEIANLLDISEGNVRQRINRGKEKLKRILSERGVEI